MSSTTLSPTKDHGIRRILINCTHSEELRVATVSGQRLDDIDIEYINKEQKKSNIYLATISRIEPSLEAVFVNYGSSKHGFLPLKEIERSYFLHSTNDPRQDFRKILREGQEILIQVEKEERGNKGAALTTYITLAGCFLVLMINNPNAGGISRRIEGDERTEMRDVLNSLTIPEGMSVIIRTAGLGKQASDLQWDLDVLLEHWQTIKNKVSNLKAPCLLHQESNVIIRAIRDNLRPNIKEILIDNEELYYQAKEYVELLRKDSKNIVKLYNGDMPIFTKFHIESQIEEAYQHEIRLPSGGSIVFDRTEALTAIDINSAQSTKGQDIENTAFNTNLEAAEEIARQLRLRDVGGLIVIDFIDMSSIKHQREVENKLREALQNDRARIQISRISRFGLLEMSRQRLKASLGENTQTTCSKCSGTGSVRTIESLSLSLIRLIEEESLKPLTRGVVAQLPLELCTFLSNEKRANIIEIEENAKIKIVLIPNPHYIFPDYKITRIKTTDNTSDEKSYATKEIPDNNNDYTMNNAQYKRPNETAAGAHASLLQTNKNSLNKPNLLKRLWSSLFSQSNSTIVQAEKRPTAVAHKSNQRAAEQQHQRQSHKTAEYNKHNKKPQSNRDNQNRNARNNLNKNQSNDLKYTEHSDDNLNKQEHLAKKQNNRQNNNNKSTPKGNRQDKINHKNNPKSNKPSTPTNKPHQLIQENQNHLEVRGNHHKNDYLTTTQAEEQNFNSNSPPDHQSVNPVSKIVQNEQQADGYTMFTQSKESDHTELMSTVTLEENTGINEVKHSVPEQNELFTEVLNDVRVNNGDLPPLKSTKKRKTDLVKITHASTMHKRSFTAKKKLKFEINNNQHNNELEHSKNKPLASDLHDQVENYSDNNEHSDHKEQ